MVSMAHANSRTGADDTSRSRDADRFRFDTDALPEKDRIAVFREEFGRQLLRLDMEPLPASRFHTDATVTSLPGLDVVWALNSPLCARLARPVLWGADGLQLLVGYLEVLRHTSTTPTQELQRLAVTHVYDLLALTLGATEDAADVAKGRGVAGARLRAIRKDIREHLSDGELHISSLARRHRLTPRYVQMLCEAEG